jgi:hypothetical protein
MMEKSQFIKNFYKPKSPLNLDLNWFTENKQILLRLSIYSGLLAISALLGPRIVLGNRLATLIFLFYLGVGAAIIFIQRPSLGVLMVIPAALVVPLNFQTGTAATVTAPVLLVPFLFGLWMLDTALHRKQVRKIKSRSLLPLITLVIVATLSFIMGQLPWFLFVNHVSVTAQIGGLAVFIISALLFILVAHQMQELRWLRYTLWTFLVIGAIYIIGRLIPPLAFPEFLQSGARGSLFWTWLAAMAFSQGLCNKKLLLPWRLALIALAIATLSVGWFQVRDWMSGWLPPLIAIMLVIWLRSWRLGLSITLLAIISKLILDPGLITDLLASDQYSMDTRFAAWKIVIGDIALVNPLLGLGPSNYYNYTAQFPIYGWYVRFNSHNQYVDIIAQTGLLGLISFTWFSFEIGLVGLRLRNKVSEGFAHAYVIGALAGLGGSLAAGMMGDWILPFVYNVGVHGMRASLLGWFFLGGLVALEQITKKPQVENLNFIR